MWYLECRGGVSVVWTINYEVFRIARPASAIQLPVFGWQNRIDWIENSTILGFGSRVERERRFTQLEGLLGPTSSQSRWNVFGFPPLFLSGVSWLPWRGLVMLKLMWALLRRLVLR